MSFNKLGSERERAYSMESDYKKLNPKSGVDIRDRHHSVYKEQMESKYTDEDWRLYEICIKNKSIITGEEARASAIKWKEAIMNEA